MSSRTNSTSRPFSIPARIYYEDTDAAGIVYYANYLKFFERCRTEWMRSIGHDQGELAREHNIAFVVRSVNIDFRKPARLDDLLEITLTVEKLGGAQVVFQQTARRHHPHNGNEALVSATVQIVCINLATMKTTPIPSWLRQSLEKMQ